MPSVVWSSGGNNELIFGVMSTSFSVFYDVVNV